MAERVTLILGENRFVVFREHLTSKSEYFASLFSPNFKDSLSNEYRINYDIKTKTLKTFLLWASDPVATVLGDRRKVKPSLKHYVENSEDFDDLLQLLQLSVLFASESLAIDLTNLIACNWLVPDKCVQIWLCAKELGLKTLTDLSKVTCVDVFCDIPNTLLLGLSGEDFIELAGNFTISATWRFLTTLVEKWTQQNVPEGGTHAFISRYPFTLMGEKYPTSDFEETYVKQQCENKIQCIVGHRVADNNEYKTCVYSWDGNNFSEIVEIPSLKLGVSNQTLTGMQAVGRGFDIYIVGGEYGIKSRIYQKEIWRYSLISKTWYYVTSMPKPRRHMVVRFADEKLFVIGGLQPNRQTRFAVDVYNVHTGLWGVAAKLREEFTNKALMCEEYRGFILIQGRNLCSYEPDENKWYSFLADFMGVTYDDAGDLIETDREIYPNFVMKWSHGLYILDQNATPPSIWQVEDFEHFESYPVGNCLTTFDTQVANGPFLIGFSLNDGTLLVERVEITSCETMETRIVYEEKRNDVVDFCLDDPIGCFNLFNPKSLNKLLVVEEKKK